MKLQISPTLCCHLEILHIPWVCHCSHLVFFLLFPPKNKNKGVIWTTQAMHRGLNLTYTFYWGWNIRKMWVILMLGLCSSKRSTAKVNKKMSRKAVTVTLSIPQSKSSNSYSFNPSIIHLLTHSLIHILSHYKYNQVIQSVQLNQQSNQLSQLSSTIK